MVFPPFFALSTHISEIKEELFLTYIPSDGPTGPKNYHQLCTTTEVPSLTAKFVVERAASDSNLVHIRSCYNNKYWCRDNINGCYMEAVASEPVEDIKKNGCTLFKPTFYGSEVTFTHVASGSGLSYYYHNYSSWLLCRVKLESSRRFKIIDYGEMVKLPKRVIFRGDNGRYLRRQWRKPCPSEPLQPFMLLFSSGKEMWNVLMNAEGEYNEFSSKNGEDRSAHYEITHYNGTIRIKSLGSGKFLTLATRSMDNWIWADSDDKTMNDKNTLFKVINLGNNVISLRNLGNNKVCRRLSSNDLVSCFNAKEDYVVPEAKLVVEEPVCYRKIHVQYKFDNARITSRRLITKYDRSYSNKGRHKDDEITASFSYQKSRTTKWTTTTTVTKGVKTEVNLSIPKVKFGGAKIEFSELNAQAESFEKGSTFTEQVTSHYKISVPPMTKVTLKGYVKQVHYDIPFSYFQTDTYTTGETIRTLVEDGICHGIETCDDYEKTSFRL